MSGPTHIDPRAAVRAEAPVDDLAQLIADSLNWVCAVCGELRVFEGGRPVGRGFQDECQQCGSPLFAAQSQATPIRVSSLA